MKKQVYMEGAVQGITVALVVLLAACAPKNGDSVDTSSAAAPATPFTATTPTTDTTTTTTDTNNVDADKFSGSGAVTDLSVLDNTVVSDYLLRNWNNQYGFKIYVGTHTVSDGSRAGLVQVGYNEAGYFRINSFNTGEGTVRVSNYGDKGKTDSTFNQWFTYNGNKVFHGFFQDAYGSVVLVIDGSSSSATSNDGTGGTTTLSGSLWYHNFAPSGYGASQFLPFPAGGERCWFLGGGPYACRTFLKKDKVKTTTALLPGDGYQELGTFKNLDASKAFQ